MVRVGQCSAYLMLMLYAVCPMCATKKYHTSYNIRIVIADSHGDLTDRPSSDTGCGDVVNASRNDG